LKIESLTIKNLVSYEERKLEDSYSDYRIDTDGSADGAGNDLVHGMHVKEESGRWKVERG